MSEIKNRSFVQTFTAVGQHIMQAAAAVGIVLLPKCGLCLIAYLNLFSVLGISLSPFASWVAPLLGLVLVFGLAVSFLKARKLGSYRTFYLSLAGSLLVVAGRLWELGALVTWIGFTIIIAGSIIQLIHGRRMCGRSLFGI